MDAFAATRLAAGTAVLLVAAASDLRTRKVPDRWWIALGSFGLAVLAIEIALDQRDTEAAMLLGSAALLFFAIFFGRPMLEEDGFHFRPVRLGVFLAAAALFVLPAAIHAAMADPLPVAVLELYTLPAMVVIYQVLYWTRLLHGGADAKGLIALTLLVPTYPDASPFPFLAGDPRVEGVFRLAFPFSLVVWVNALVLFLGIPIGLFAANLVRGDIAVPLAFLGYRARIDAFPRHAWLMEKIDARGEHVAVLFPRRGGDPAQDLARLREAGVRRVWVTPKIPFMVLLLGGFLLAFLAGNLLLALLNALT